MTRDNLTPAGVEVQISKTKKKLLIEYSPTLLAAIEASKKLKPQVLGHALISTRQGQPYSMDGFASNWQRLIRKAMKQGEQRFAFSAIRKKAATDMKNKAGLELAANLRGHASSAVTSKHYVTDEDVIVTKPLK